MSLLRSLVELRMPGPEVPEVPLTDSTLLAALGGTPSWSGRTVTAENSLQVAAVYACVRLLSESVAMLPVDLLSKRGDRRVVVPPENRYADLIGEEPNPEIDAGELWRIVMASMLLRGNGFVYMQANRRTGQVEALWPLPADRVDVMRVRTTQRLAYKVRLPTSSLDRAGPAVDLDRSVVFLAEEVLHYRAFGTGPIGLSPVTQARQTIGLSMAQEEYAARFFANDARPGGVIQAPKTLSDKAYDRLKANWNALHQGVQRAHLMALLEEGAEWKSIGLTNEDAQFLESRRFQVNEITRWFGVPPHMVGDVERSTSWGRGIEHQGIQFVVFSLMWWLTRLERVTKRGLLRPVDRSWYPKWNVGALLRGDMKSRAAALAIMRQWGVINGDEWRAFEDMDPIEGGAGQVYLQPGNFSPLGTSLVGARGAPPATDEAALEDRIREIAEELLAEALSLNGHH